MTLEQTKTIWLALVGESVASMAQSAGAEWLCAQLREIADRTEAAAKAAKTWDALTYNTEWFDSAGRSDR